MNSTLSRLLAISLTLILSTVFTFFLCRYVFRIDQIEVVAGIIGIEIAIVALYVTYWLGEAHHKMIVETQDFARRHETLLEHNTTQLKHLEDIQHTLGTSTAMRRNVDQIFFFHHETTLKYKLIFPVEYANRPLPLIAGGDFYALHILQTAVGIDRIRNHT
jgi:hypothetical protein